ncbi:MAG: DUF1616 domain-containing protein [Fervidicoccaceae archaeon]
MEETLEEYVKKLAKGKRAGYREIKIVMDKVKRGELMLEDPMPPGNFREYLFTPSYSAWLWTSITILVISLFIIALSSFLQFLLPLRYILGSIFVLFLPGYALIEALYPLETDLSPLERLALSIGLSLALVPLLGLLLNYTPWGIRLNPVAISLSLLTLLMLLLASWRKYSALRILYAGEDKKKNSAFSHLSG